MEGIVPISRPNVWKVLWLHLDERVIREIHPWILRGRLVRDEGQQTYGGLTFPARHVVDRAIRIAGRTLENTWTYQITPPDAFDYRIRGSEGFVSSFHNTYREEGSSTRILTEADLHIGRVPAFLQRIVARRLLSRSDEEDMAYVRRHGLRWPEEAALPKST